MSGLRVVGTGCWGELRGLPGLKYASTAEMLKLPGIGKQASSRPSIEREGFQAL